MLWKLLLTIASMVSSPFRGPAIPDRPYEATPWGPQNWEEAARASHALHGHGSDILYYEEEEPSYAGIKNTTYRWPGYPGAGTIPYVLAPNVQNNATLVQLIDDAIEQYEKNTCIRFVKRTNEQSYVRIIRDRDLCYSVLGLDPQVRQPQPLSLGWGCEFIGTVVHELGHAIGLYHEHQRSDRDNHINYYPQNVLAGREGNFNMTDINDELKWASYDYTSIMHYGEYAFSKDPGVLKTMEAKDGKTELKEPYERPGLNQNDIDLVKKLYKCK